MAHILIVTDKLIGRRNATFELIRRLQGLGHQVTYSSNGDFADASKELGIPFVPLIEETRPRDVTHRKLASGGRLQNLIANSKGFMNIRQRRQVMIESIERDLTRFTEQLSALVPDLVLIDVEMQRTVIATWNSGVPLALLSGFFTLYKRPGVPPGQYFIVPGEGWAGSPLGIQWAWLRHRVRQWLWIQHEQWQYAGLGRLAVLRLYAKVCGFPSDREFMPFQWLRPCAFRSFPVLTTHASEFDFPYTPRHNAKYIGPMIRADRANKDNGTFNDSSNRLEKLLAARTQDNAKRKLIYLSFGTYLSDNDQPVFRRIIDAVTGLPDWQLVVGLGGRHRAHDIHPNPPDNVYLFDWVPQVRVLAHADCAIHHAGSNTIHECIHFDVPMLLYPVGFNPPGNAARVVYHNLGIVGDLTHDTPQTIQQYIKELLDDPSYRQAIVNMREKYERYDSNHLVEVIGPLIPPS